MKPKSQPTPEVARHVAVAACSASHSGAAAIAVAPCLFQFGAAGADGLIEIQVTPAGAFRARDGRPTSVDAWKIDASIAAQLIERFRKNQTPRVIDYEHQTLQAEENGQPAPAAGFIRDLEWREGRGLFAKVELTARAKQYVQDGEYRYFSPVFLWDKRTGAVLDLLMGALTNNPALDGMAPVELRAAARFALNEDSTMNKHLLALCCALALTTDNQTEEQLETAALAKIEELKTAGDLAALRKELSLADDAGAEEITSAIAALKSKTAAAGEPDPSKYVPVAVVTEMRTELAALTAQNTERAVDDLVKPALEDGRLLPAQEKWARDLGKKDIAALTAFLKDAEPIAALRGSQTNGQPRATRDENGLSADELAVCTATGVDPKEFAKNKQAAAA